MTDIVLVLAQALVWYIAMTLIGALALPLAARLLRILPDRGLSVARPIGLVIAGYTSWLLASTGLLQNDTGGAIFGLVVLGLLSAWALWHGRAGDWRAAWRRQRRSILVMEAVFVLAFLLWTLVRAASPQASGTEKPMELAFIQSILRSPQAPPADPWLSGYAISYYYFGYHMVAMLARLAGMNGTVAFNLASAGWFGMTALAAYGLLFNLLHLRAADPDQNSAPSERAIRLGALFAPLFVLLVSNFGGLLEVLHAGGVFWSNGQSRFWSWLNIPELVNPPTPPYTWAPERLTGIWWWRASRVIADYDLNGGFREVIDEFPMFSYLLGDLHPHVLAMPFALLAAALALNTYYLFRGDAPAPAGSARWLRQPDFWLAALLLGALAFLNTWDWPMYLVLVGAATALAGVAHSGWRWGVLLDFGAPVLALGLAGALLYLPFFLTFSSQAQGLLPALVYFTRGAHFWVMFGPLLLPILAWLAAGWLRGAQRGRALVSGGLLAGALLLGLFLLMLAFAWLRLQAEPGLGGKWGANSTAQLFAETFRRRLVAPGAWVTLWALLALVVAHFRRGEPAGQSAPAPTADRFVLLLVLVGAGLVIFPEFFYLRDGFGTRMNTIFKFAFQAWILWAVAAGFAVFQLLRRLVGWKRGLYGLAVLLLVGVSLPYGWFWTASRFEFAAINGFSLDGSALSPDEQQAVEWLAQARYGVVAEAVGGSYTGFARISTHSGLPTVIGWPGHELQWRGGVQEIGSRETDIEQLYRARNWPEAQSIIDRYNIAYIVIGDLERSTYRPNEDFFRQNLPAGFENQQVIIFMVPQSPVEEIGFAR